MANSNVVTLDQVPKDFDPEVVKGVYNPLNVEFSVLFGGKEVVLGPGEYKPFPETKAVHIAKHLAKKILTSGMNDFLLKNFPGMDEMGREKWKMNMKTFYTKQDVVQLATQLVFDFELGEPLPAKKELEHKFKERMVSEKTDATVAAKEPSEDDSDDDEDGVDAKEGKQAGAKSAPIKGGTVAKGK